MILALSEILELKSIAAEMRAQRKKRPFLAAVSLYTSDVSNVFDWMTIILTLMAGIVWIQSYRNGRAFKNKLYDLSDVVNLPRPIDNTIADLTQLVQEQFIYKTLAGTACICYFVEAIKSISAFGSFAMLVNMLRRSLAKLSYFLVMFMLLIVAYSVGGMLVFGHHVYEFSTFAEAFKSMFGIVMGTFDTEPIDSLLWGSVTICFVWSFNIILVWILLNGEPP